MIQVKYPKQIASIKQSKDDKKKTLSIEAELYPADIENGDCPLEMHRGYSRFLMTIIDKTDESKYFLTANIPVGDLAFIQENTRMYRMISRLQNKKPNRVNVESTTQKAYHVKIKVGVLKGMTPAAALIKDSTNMEQLRRTLSFLEEKGSQYVGNQEQIDAIKEAIQIYEAGKLTVDAENNSSDEDDCYVIYDEPIKPQLRREKRESDGFCFVYGIKISYDPTRNYPIVINIYNCYAPLKKNLPMMKEAKDRRESVCHMTEKEWLNILDRMDRTLTNFELLHAKRLWNEAEQYSKQNRS